MGSHQKHTPLVKPQIGEFGRNEIAIMGTPCGNIRKLAFRIIDALKSDHSIAYIDADHKNEDSENISSSSALHYGAKMDFTDKISHLQINKSRNDNPYQLKKSYLDQDLILVNGNHFKASQQILVIDPKKDLEKKRDRINDVKMIILKEHDLAVPDFLKSHLGDIKQTPVYNFEDTEKIVDNLKLILKNTIPQIKGLVLAGGKSERMKQDKGLINYHGLPQREHAAELLSEYCSEVFISCRPDQIDSIGEKYNALPDTFSGLGPFGGIASAFRLDPNSAWLAIACDLPYLDSNTLDYLISNRDPSKMATSFWDSDHKFPEPLITIWEPKAYSELLYFLSLGHSCPRKVLINSEIALVEVPDKYSLTNVNNPEEMKRVLEDVQNGK